MNTPRIDRFVNGLATGLTAGLFAYIRMCIRIARPLGKALGAYVLLAFILVCSVFQPELREILEGTGTVDAFHEIVGVAFPDVDLNQGNDLQVGTVEITNPDGVTIKMTLEDYARMNPMEGDDSTSGFITPAVLTFLADPAIGQYDPDGGPIYLR